MTVTEDPVALPDSHLLFLCPAYSRHKKVILCACIPVADAAQTVAEIDPATIRMIGWPGASYDRYDDDGVTIPAE